MNDWVQPDSEIMRQYGFEVAERKNWIKLRCTNCGNTWGVNPRSDGKILAKDAVCRNCQEKQNPY